MAFEIVSHPWAHKHTNLYQKIIQERVKVALALSNVCKASCTQNTAAIRGSGQTIGGKVKLILRHSVCIITTGQSNNKKNKLIIRTVKM